MGANEKHQAAYHGTTYTPTSGDIREVWVAMQSDPWTRSTANAEFDRWLEKVHAEAKAEALEEYADAIQHVDDVIQRDADADDRWCDFQDAEREFNRNGGDQVRDYYSATTHYARYRAAQIRSRS